MCSENHGKHRNRLRGQKREVFNYEAKFRPEESVSLSLNCKKN